MTEETISLNGKEYNSSNLTTEQEYICSQISDLQRKSQETKFQLDQITTALNSFIHTLIENFENGNTQTQEINNG